MPPTMQGISPQLIIFRVAVGNAWTKKCVSSEEIPPTAMQFKDDRESTIHILQGGNEADSTTSKEDV